MTISNFGNEVLRVHTLIKMPASKFKTVDVLNEPISDEDLLSVYRWLDIIFTRPKKSAPHRDFADGVLMAELVAHYIPKIVNIHHYFAASATSMKIANWDHLNSKVFSKIRFQLTPKLISAVANARPGMIERVLQTLRPILLRGPDAISPPASKLDNIKSRFMEIGQRYKHADTTEDINSGIPGLSSLRSVTATRAGTPRGMSTTRSRSAGHGSHSRKNSTSSQDRACDVRCTPVKPRFKTNPDSSILTKQKFTQDASNSTADYEPEGKFESSPTRNLEKEKYTSPTPTLTKGENMKSAKKSPSCRKQPVYTSSWLPREMELEQDIDHGRETQLEDKKEEDLQLEIIHKNNKKHNNYIDDEDEEADEEIYSHGYIDDSTEISKADSHFHKAISVESCGLPTFKPNPKRKVKRVLKYEYREEYVLNVGLPYQLEKDK